MRSKLLLPIILLLIVIAGSFIFYFFLNPNKKPNQNGKNISGSMYDLVTLNKNLLCTFSEEKNNVTMSGIIYTSGNKFAADLQTVASNNGIITHLIGSGEKVYVWSDFSNLPGVTISYNDFKTPKTQQQKSGIIYKNNMYNCSAWKVDESKFKLPENKQFK